MLDILYEDNHLIAVNKRPGDLVQGDKTGDIPLVEKVKIYIKKKHNGTLRELRRSYPKTFFC